MTRRSTVSVVLVAVITAGTTWFFGVDVVPSLAVGGVVAAVGLTWTAVREGVPLTWPEPPVRTAPGARRGLAETAWTLRSRGGVPERAISRARAVAEARLRTHHRLGLDDPDDRAAIEAVVPPAVVAVLRREQRSEVDLAAFRAVLTAIEAIGPSAEHPATTATDTASTERRP